MGLGIQLKGRLPLRKTPTNHPPAGLPEPWSLRPLPGRQRLLAAVLAPNTKVSAHRWCGLGPEPEG